VAAPPTDEHRFVGAEHHRPEHRAHGPPFDPNHGVTFLVNIDWQALTIVTDITVLDNPPIEVDH
jgi:hypothetical protein